jgi:putative addiction module killer protein
MFLENGLKNCQKGYRVYFTIRERKLLLLLLNGGGKKTQEKDIKIAIKLKNVLKGEI